MLAGLIALAASACSIAPAAAGEYEVWSCRGPDGQPLSTDAWVPRTFNATSGDVTLTDDCASGGPVALTLTDNSTGTRRPRLEYGFDVPRGAKIIGYRLLRGLRAAASIPGYFYVAAVSEVDGANVHDFGCASGLAFPDFQCSVQGSLTDPDNPGNELITTAVTLDQLSVFVACTSLNGCVASPFGFAADVALFGATVTIEDDDPPTLAGIGGSLAGGRPVYGDAGLFVRATDTNAGVASMSLEIDGQLQQTIDISTGTCSQPYVLPRPCPADAGRLFEVDTTNLAEGNHVAGVTITDAAGNQTSFGPVTFTVKSPGPQPSNGTPAVAQPELTLASTSIWQRRGAAATVRGRLTTAGGMPIEGASLEAEASVLNSTGPKSQRLPAAVTSADGTFEVNVRGQGTRNIDVSFAPGIGQAVTARASAQIRTRLAVTFKAKPRQIRTGGKVRFQGRLLGTGPASRGVPVDIQAKVEGKWETVATVSTRANGAFVWRYRFRHVNRNALFSFRATVRNAPGWPWPTVKSPLRKVRIKVARR